MPLISAKKYNDFCIDFYTDKRKQELLRFGQAFCNEFNVTDSTLFYEESSIKSRVMIFEKYVTVDS